MAISTTDKRLGILCFSCLMACWIWGIFFAAPEKHQGDVYRILYVHVPAAATAFALSFLLMIQGIINLKNNQGDLIFLGKSLAELGLVFTLITLITGSLWGRSTWGVWWTWDARLTTTFLLALLYIGYLLIWNSVSDSDHRVKICGILSVLIALDVPIIYKSVTWWRTLHQPPSLLRKGGSTMDPEILKVLLVSILVTLITALWLCAFRYRILRSEEQLRQHALATFN